MIHAFTGTPTTIPLTMACWFYANDVTGIYTLLGLATSDINNDDRLRLIAAGTVASDPIRFEAISNAGAASNIDTAVGYTANTWNHACAVVASSTSRVVWLNAGASGTSTTARIVTGLDRTSIGGAYTGSLIAPFYMNGNIAEVGFWASALSSGDVASLARGVSPQLVSPTSLIFYAPLIRDIKELRGVPLLSSGNNPAFPSPRVYGR